MNKFFRTIGIMAFAAVIGFTMVSCGDSGDSPVAKSITITGITGKTGEVMLGLLSKIAGRDDPVAVGAGNISGGSVKLDIYNIDATPWTGSGSYYLMIIFEDDDIYIYTNGAAFTDEDDAVKFGISSASSTIDFGKFKYASSL